MTARTGDIPEPQGAASGFDRLPTDGPSPPPSSEPPEYPSVDGQEAARLVAWRAVWDRLLRPLPDAESADDAAPTV